MGFMDDIGLGGLDFSQLLSGAGGGAMLGSMIPGVGTLLGAGIGAGISALGSQGSGSYQDMLKQMAQGYGKRQAPQAGPASRAGYSSFRSNQAGLISQLESMARGEGPSAATTMMREAMDKEAGAQSSAAAGAGGRGVNAGAALRNAANNTASLQAQNARDTGLMRVNEQLGAIGQLGGAISQGRAADEGVNMFNAGQSNDMSRANLQAKLQQMGMNDQSQLQALMAAMQAAGPGLGTQLLAGGASAMPQIMQYQMMQKLMQQGGGGGYSPFSGYYTANPAVPAGGNGNGNVTDYTGISG